MSKKSLFYIILVLMFIILQAPAQVLDPVSWSFSQVPVDDNQIDLVFTARIENKWHLYSQHLPEGGPIPTSFTFNESSDYRLSGDMVEVSVPEIRYDPGFNIDVKMFSHESEFRQRIAILTENIFTLSGSIEYMTCDDKRCLPPVNKEFSFNIGGKQTTVDKTGNSETIKSAEKQLDIVEYEESDSIRGITDYTQEGKPGEGSSLWLFFLISFLAGLAAILTPCVFPMIPMTITFFMQGSENRIKAVMKGLIFGVSVILIYTLIGFIVALTNIGADFASQLSTHWIPNLIFFIFFMIFAVSFLGMFELVLPGRWVNSADKQADKGGYTGAFFMAFTLVLVSFSCTGPIVGAILVESAGGLAIKPVVGMLGFSVAFALPFTLLSIFPSWLKNLPRSGSWLNSVKVVLGFIVLGSGFKFLSIIDQTYHLNVLSREVFLSLWIVIFTLMGFYLLGKLKLAHDNDIHHIGVLRLILAIITFTFVVYLIPGLFGAPLTGISALIPPKTSRSFDFTPPGQYSGSGAESSENLLAELCGTSKYSGFLHLPYDLTGFFDYQEGIACAKQQNKPVFLDFKGHACSNCWEMEAKVWSNPEVLKRLRENFIIIALYVDDKTKLPEDEWVTSEFDGKVKKTLGKKNLDIQITMFNTNTQPFYIITEHNGKPLNDPVGFELNVQKYIDFLDEGIRNFNNLKRISSNKL